MIQVSVTDLRQHLPTYLKRVEAGEEIRITSRGRVVARIQPEQDLAEEARLWLESLRDNVIGNWRYCMNADVYTCLKVWPPRCI